MTTECATNLSNLDIHTKINKMLGLNTDNGWGAMATQRTCSWRSAPRRYRRRFLAAISFAFIHQSIISAQEIGLDLCACQPSVYEFTFDLDLTCDDQDVGGEGISATTCLTELRGQENQEDADLVPVSVGQVSVFELDQNLDVIAQTVNTGNYLTGSTFTYTSIIATEPDMLNPDSLPRGLQLVIIGINALNQAVVNTFAILYDNDCGVFPLLREGQQAGWVIFVSKARCLLWFDQSFISLLILHL